MTGWMKTGVAVGMLAGACCQSLMAQAFIARDGSAQAQIVVAENPPRMVKLAAEELRDYVRKIAGAELPIVAESERLVPGSLPVTIYVGKSQGTDRLGISDEGLDYGAYRMVSGPGWLALVGRDFDYEPVEPWAHSRGDSERAQRDWDKVTGAKWGNPMSSAYRALHGELGIWEHDEGGSLSAVCGFLRTLGVRWYMPGELGEVVPKIDSIPLPEMNVTMRPDYRVRVWLGSNYTNADRDTIMWERRVGINGRFEALGAGMMTHGMRNVQGHADMKEMHPEYYALYGGRRETDFRGTGHACFSAEGLKWETVGYVRTVFDHFGEPSVQMSPQDGFRQCQCRRCWGASVSDYVFGFLDRVAREVQKTHPDRMVLGAAYSSYRNPPESIEAFSSNVGVSINNVGRPGFTDPGRWEWYLELVEGWREKLGPGMVLRVENNRYTLRGGRELPVHWPVIHPRSMAKDLRAMKGVSMGERNEISRGERRSIHAPGVNHLNLYVNARYLWDADRDIEELLDEYYALFFGPAGEAMRAAMDFAEANATTAGLPEQIRLVEMLRTAREAAGDSVYGSRVQIFLDELRPLDAMRRELERKIAVGDPRKDAPVAVARDMSENEELNAYGMKNLHTGEATDIATEFRVGWDDGALYFDIKCHEPDMENLFVSRDIWGGDSVAILLESPEGGYYQIEINPDGELFDAGREYGKVVAKWESSALVKTERGDDYWRVEARVPVVAAEDNEGDPYNFVVGPKPSAADPWHFNVGRVRIRDGEKTAYAFSPTGGGYHRPEKFARLVVE